MGKALFDATFQLTCPAWAQPTAKWRVLLVAAGLADDDGELVVTVGRIGELAAISERQTQRYMAELKHEGFVTIREPGRGQGRPNVYRVTIPDGWRPPLTGAWWEEPVRNTN